MKVTKLDKQISRNKELRKAFPSGIARTYNRIFESAYCMLVPWNIIEDAEVGDTIENTECVWHTNKVLIDNGWCTTAEAKRFLEQEQIEFEKEMETLLVELRKICEKQELNWSQIVRKSLL